MKANSYPLSLGLDHPSVQEVLELAKELVKEHKIINVELLYNRAKKELKFPRKGLLAIIQMLINRKILVDGSKFTKESVLSNQNRYNIYRFIKIHIGAHFSLIKNQIGLGVGQLIWHLEMLLKFNIIKKIKVSNYSIFLPAEIDEEIGVFYFLLRDELNQKIINFILNCVSVKKSDIYKKLNINRENTYYRINNLIKLEIICTVSEDNKLISINPIKKNLIIEVMNDLLYINRIYEKNRLISMNI